MGFEDEVEQSLQRPCRQTKRQVQADMRTHLIHRPARDIIHRSVELEFPSIGFDPVEFSCCCRGLSPGPTELGAVHPDAVHDHGQPTRQRHDRLFHPATPGNLHRRLPTPPALPQLRLRHRIKRVTGGDPIDARDLNKSFFTFFAQFKLTIACNPKPRITGTDGGIWRRVVLLPWLEQIPEAERDKHLKAKLRAEGPGSTKSPARGPAGLSGATDLSLVTKSPAQQRTIAAKATRSVASWISARDRKGARSRAFYMRRISPGPNATTDRSTLR